VRIVPWPSRAARRENVASARQQARESRRKAGEAAEIAGDLHRISEENHFSEMIMAAITGMEPGRRDGGIR